MNNFKSSGPGGLRKRNNFIGGRPKSDANYGAKKSFGDKPRFGGNDRGGDRGGSRDGGRGGNDRGGDRKVELFKTTCTTCGKACEVPFRPDGSKPVLCRDCFANKPDDRGSRDRNDRTERRPERSFDAPRSDRGSSPDFKALERQVAALEGKVNQVLELLQSVPKAAKVAAKAAPLVEITEPLTDVSPKIRKLKKEVVKKVVKKAAKKAIKKAK